MLKSHEWCYGVSMIFKVNFISIVKKICLNFRYLYEDCIFVYLNRYLSITV